MQVFYYIALKSFAFAIIIASLFNKKARIFKYGRKNLFTELETTIPKNTAIAWFHCPSFGEFEQGRPLIEAYRKQHPEQKILLTFFSPSGYEHCKNYQGADYIFYLPLDSPRNARKFIDIVKPQVVFFIKYDFWHYFLKYLRKQKIRTYLVSAIFRPSQVFFKWHGSFFRNMLRAYTFLFVQNQTSVKLLESIGITNVAISGDTRFDRVWELLEQSKTLPILEQFCKTQPTIIAGSTWSEDEEILATVYPTLPNCKMVIAPHQIHEEHIATIEKQFAAFGVVRYSKCNENTSFQSVNILILDTMGMLSSAYKYGQIAFIGGGFGAAGIHNALEPAVFGVPIVFGPIYDMFHEACELVELGGTLVFKTKNELATILTQWLEKPEEGVAMGAINKNYVAQNRGATERIMREIN